MQIEVAIFSESENFKNRTSPVLHYSIAKLILVERYV